MRTLIFLFGWIGLAGGCRPVEPQLRPQPPDAQTLAPSAPVPSGGLTIIEVNYSTTEVRTSTTSNSSIEFLGRPEPQDYSWPEERVPQITEKKCCRVCHVGQACGNTCIARDRICSTLPGCACDI